MFIYSLGAIESLRAQQERVTIKAELPQIETVEDLVKLVSRWCSEWQRFVQRTLYGGRGLDFTIGKLELERPAR